MSYNFNSVISIFSTVTAIILVHMVYCLVQPFPSLYNVSIEFVTLRKSNERITVSYIYKIQLPILSHFRDLTQI